MNLSIPSIPRRITRTKLSAESTLKGHPKPERVEDVYLQEQVALPRPVCNERPAAEVLAERLAESCPVSPAVPMFVP
jgi:hypothetical protein